MASDVKNWVSEELLAVSRCSRDYGPAVGREPGQYLWGPGLQWDHEYCSRHVAFQSPSLVLLEILWKLTSHHQGVAVRIKCENNVGNGLSILVKILSSIPQTGTWSWIPGIEPGQPAMTVAMWRRLAGGSLTFSIWKSSSSPCGSAHLTTGLSGVGKGNQQLAGLLSFEDACSLGALHVVSEQGSQWHFRHTSFISWVSIPGPSY